MVPRNSRQGMQITLTGLLLAAIVLGACKQATATPDTNANPTATVTTAAEVDNSNDNGNQSQEEPSETSAPTEDQSILFQDDFSDIDSGWPTVQIQGAVGSYQDPEIYQLLINAPNTLLLASRPGAFADFSVEAIVTGSGESSGQFRYGLAFRGITADNYYAAFVNPATQGYLLAKRFLGEWTTLAEGQNAAIPTDAQAVTLRIDAHGPDITFSINGTGLVSIKDTSFAAGDVGFVAETLDGPAARMDADSIIIRRFDAATVPPAPTGVPVIPTATPTPAESATATEPAVTARPVSSLQPPATQKLPSTQEIQATVGAAATNLAATANAVATQACGLLGCP